MSSEAGQGSPAGGERRRPGPGGLRDVTMAVAMVELCEGAGMPLLAAALLGSLLPGAPQPGSAQPRLVQGQRCPAGYPPGDLGEERGPRSGRGGAVRRDLRIPAKGVRLGDQAEGVERPWESGPFQATDRLQSQNLGGKGVPASTSQ